LRDLSNWQEWLHFEKTNLQPYLWLLTFNCARDQHGVEDAISTQQDACLY
jgi:endonuclease/exonuclease/phosphatase (EEP) superfamily protein YafD